MLSYQCILIDSTSEFTVDLCGLDLSLFKLMHLFEMVLLLKISKGCCLTHSFPPPLCSISSTIMDVDSTISSGRSTPVMMNGQGIAASSTKSIAYNCCWDQCHTCFNSSPDLADHIRAIHVDGQQGGVRLCFFYCCFVYYASSSYY